MLASYDLDAADTQRNIASEGDVVREYDVNIMLRRLQGLVSAGRQSAKWAKKIDVGDRSAPARKETYQCPTLPLSSADYTRHRRNMSLKMSAASGAFSGLWISMSHPIYHDSRGGVPAHIKSVKAVANESTLLHIMSLKS